MVFGCKAWTPEAGIGVLKAHITQADRWAVTRLSGSCLPAKDENNRANAPSLIKMVAAEHKHIKCHTTFSSWVHIEC